MRVIWRPAQPGDSPGQLVPGEADPAPAWTCTIAGFQLTTLALGRRRVYHLRREWPRPTERRRRSRRPAGLTVRGAFR